MAARKPRQRKPKARAFRIRSDAERAGEPVTGISFGASPHVHIGAGSTFATTDERLAARLAADPALEEVTQ